MGRGKARRYRLMRWLREHQNVIPMVASLTLAAGTGAAILIFRYVLPVLADHQFGL